MTKPIAPSAMWPRKRLTIFPMTCAAIKATASRHPQRQRRNQPTAAAKSVAPSKRKGIPIIHPRGASSRRAREFSAQAWSSAVPGQTKVIPARNAIAVPNSKKMPTPVIPWGTGTGAECGSTVTY